MLQFLNPIWLFGASAILIPLLIHLWNVKTGKTLKVGSIALMGESSRQNSRSFKLMDLLLLFLRCLLIVLIAMLLAEPVWLNTGGKEKEKSWLLVERGTFAEARRQFRPTFDSLLTLNSELHYFEPGFPKTDTGSALSDTIATLSQKKLPYFSLLRLLQEKAPANIRAYLFTDNSLNRFSGSKPEIPANIFWNTYTSPGPNSKWIDNAYLSASGEIRAVLAESSPAGTISKTYSAGSIAGAQTGISKGQPVIMFNGGEIVADTATIRIAVHSEFPGDAGYLRAAVNAIRNYTSRKIKWVDVNSPKDFLFWLSVKDIPAGAQGSVNPRGKIFKYGRGKTIAANSWIESNSVGLSTEPPALHMRVTYPHNINPFPVWEDGFGSPLLDLTSTKGTASYTLYTRLNPRWTDLVWSPDFVKLLLPLIIPETQSAKADTLDKRIFNGDLITQTSYVKPPTSVLRPQTSDLSHSLWFALMLLFITERWLSFKKNGAI